MDATLRALGQVLLQAIPTFFIVIFLYFYLKGMFFTPLAKTLAKRRALTQGAREQAQESLERAEKSAAEYEQSLRNVQRDLAREAEEHRRRWREEQTLHLTEARRRAEEQLAFARQETALQSEEVRRQLTSQAEELAVVVARSITGRKTAA